MAPLRKRRRTDPAREAMRAAFDPVATAVEAAQRALLAAIPTSRDEGVPLAQALAAFGARLEQAAGAVEAWEGGGDLRERCRRALAEARARADRLRLEPGALGFEALNARVGDVLHPLEDVADAEREIRRM